MHYIHTHTHIRERVGNDHVPNWMEWKISCAFYAFEALETFRRLLFYAMFAHRTSMPNSHDTLFILDFFSHVRSHSHKNNNQTRELRWKFVRISHIVRSQKTQNFAVLLVFQLPVVISLPRNWYTGLSMGVFSNKLKRAMSPEPDTKCGGRFTNWHFTTVSGNTIKNGTIINTHSAVLCDDMICFFFFLSSFVLLCACDFSVSNLLIRTLHN